jgi:hypothetical protein
MFKTIPHPQNQGQGDHHYRRTSPSCQPPMPSASHGSAEPFTALLTELITRLGPDAQRSHQLLTLATITNPDTCVRLLLDGLRRHRFGRLMTLVI